MLRKERPCACDRLVVQCRKVDAQCPFLHSLDAIWQFDMEGIMPHRTTVFKDRPNERKINLKYVGRCYSAAFEDTYICSLFDALATTSLMCKSHLRLLWIVTPNTLYASTDSRALVFMAKADGRWSKTLRKRKVISLHFLGLRTILFVAADVVKFRLQN